jgi:hypothetical protein
MRTTVATLICLILSFTTLFAAPVLARQAPEPTAEQTTEQQAEKPKEPKEELKEGVSRVTERAGEKLTEFAAYADGLFEKATSNRLLGWLMLALAAVGGLISIFYGWSLIQRLLIPFAPFWGLMTGGGIAFCLISAFYTERETWFKLLLLVVGVGAGLALYLFSALRAKPVAAFLVILSPFLILAAFLFPIHDTLGLVIFCAGFVAGFAAMIEVRPLAIVSTSFFGAGCLLAAVGILSHLIGDGAPWLRDFFQWLAVHPLALVVALAVLTFLGSNFQFMTGPRGTLED